MFLLDTNVVSELRKAHTVKINKNVTVWATSVSAEEMYLSVITVLELELGILLMERRDKEQGKILRFWFDRQVIPAFSQRIIEMDTSIAKCCAGLHVPDRRSDRDAMIAATALVHGMTVVTRNVSNFYDTGVSILNPWDS
jgi:predicted nucleic acid-binding protein